MKRLIERLDDFMRFCLDWGSAELAKASKEVAEPQAASPLLVLLIIIFGASALMLAVWLSDVLGWSQ
jgi:hypothetical protein